LHRRYDADQEVEPNPVTNLQPWTDRLGTDTRDAYVAFWIVDELKVDVVRQLPVNADWLKLAKDGVSGAFEHVGYQAEG